MKLEISKDISIITNCCRNNNSCLNGELNFCCKIVSCVNGQVHFVEPITKHYCNNQINFGDSCFCICPTRKEIFNKYGL